MDDSELQAWLLVLAASSWVSTSGFENVQRQNIHKALARAGHSEGGFHRRSASILDAVKLHRVGTGCIGV